MTGVRFFFSCVVIYILATGSAQACGVDTNCQIGDRHYRILMPEDYNSTEKIGALVWSHGYRGSASGMMKNKSMARLANQLGIALIATKSLRDDWDIPGTPSNVQSTGAAEFAYFDALIEDVTTRFSIDPARLVATGFSAGGMMVWNLACHRSQKFAGFIPIAGTFWEPTPEACKSEPASIVHIHGTEDRIVPLRGRKIANTRQGDIFNVLEMYKMHGGYKSQSTTRDKDLSCENHLGESDEILNFCTFTGGHSFKSEYVRQGWEMLEAAGKL
ncbi:MAG: prolyl oligopeptidase family serine peptidase [Pseudomonadota bacterium]